MGGGRRRAGAETAMGRKVRREQSRSVFPKIQWRRGEGTGEPLRNTGSREGCSLGFSERLNQVKSLLMGRMSLREYISNCLSFTEKRGMIVYKGKEAGVAIRGLQDWLRRDKLLMRTEELTNFKDK